MNQLCRKTVLTALLMAAGLLSVVNSKKAMAADKHYYDIGMNGWVSINEDDDPDQFYGYVRFCPKKDGAITFSVSGDDKLIQFVRLMKKNSSGDYVSISDDSSLENYNDEGGKSTATFGVKKGVNYALRVEMDGSYWIDSKFKSVKDTGGKKKSSAKTLKKGKTQYGLLLIGGKKSRWYKFKVPKTKKVSIQFKGWGNGRIGYQIIVKGMETINRSVWMNNWDFNPGKNDLGENTKAKKMTATLKKGTVVYLRAYSIYKDDSGYYSWKWN